ncbi:sodium/proline symporter PutP [Succinispira mobilis]|uniref:sodium/proline symporter PutP n=1 Tax=Succinispira mobilis TaxID=78120 RepID=UPI000491F049|nr:sodium/proline symporter PutP [Succinispira mobilis]
MQSINIGILIAFLLYLFAMVAIGVWHYYKTQDLSDYILGGRQLNPWVTSMSSVASDMSGWMLMGLPGFAYVAGISAYWIAIGLALGTWLNWQFVAKRLRNYTQLANDSLTIPDFFENRFRDKSKSLRIISAIFIFIFFLVYTSSGFVAGGKLFNTVFGIPYLWSLIISAGVVVSYTFLGGFKAVCWTDFCQGVLMFIAVIAVPATGIYLIGGPSLTIQTLTTNFPEHLNMFTNPDGSNITFISIISLLAWGLGYFGQPHILVRFMAIRSAKEISAATKIAMTWIVFSLSAAVIIGLVGRVYIHPELTGSAIETVFMVMTEQFYVSFFAGVILSAILAAIMSTASSQLLVTASSIAQDFYQALIRKNASEQELVLVSRITVILVSILAIIVASNPDNLVLDLVAYAWAGFGAAFGPLVLVSLFWRNATRNGALAGIFVGGSTVLLWKYLGNPALYEIVPAFIASFLAIIIVSKLEGSPSQEILNEFKAFEKLNKEN